LEETEGFEKDCSFEEGGWNIDAVDNSDSECDDGDFIAHYNDDNATSQRYIPDYTTVTRDSHGRGSNSSRSASLSSGSWSPQEVPVVLFNTFGTLNPATPAPAAPSSWDYRPSPAHSRVSEESTESVTDRIIREIEESRVLFGIQKSTVQDTIVETPHEPAVGTTGIAAPPGLQGAPVSCYTSSFASWTFNRDVIPSLEESEDDDDEVDDDVETANVVEEVETLPKRFCIDKSPEQQPAEPVERTFAEIGVQTELSLSLNASDIRWTPTIDERRSSPAQVEVATSTLERAIAAQQQDVLPAAVDPGEETDTDDESGDDTSVARNIGRDDDQEASDAVIGEFEDDMDSMSTRMQKIGISERATTDDGGSLLTATGSVEASSHHTDEEGTSEIRVGDTIAAAGASLNLEDIFDVGDSETPPLLAVGEDDVDMTKPKKKTTSGKKMRLKRGITMDTGAHHNVMPKRMAGKRVIRPSPGSKRGMCYVAAGNERIKNEGEVTFDFESLEGHVESFVFQIAEVNKALGSGAYMVDRAFRVVYDKDMDTGEDLSYMIHKPTKKVFRFRREKNVWILDAVVTAESVFGFSGPE
jgi:hypothetical protein